MIDIANVTTGYQGIPMIHNISFQIKKGSVTSIIGLNGSGKTTLLKTISGLLLPYHGSVTLDGSDISNIKPIRFAKKLSYLPQIMEYPNIRVYDLIMYGRFPHMKYPRIPSKEDKNKVEEALDTLKLQELKDRTLNELSGGQRQKAYIAMTLAQDTEIILFDEPTTFLDINHQLEILDIIKKLKTMGKTILLVLHDINYAFSYSDKICILEQGKLMAYDSPEKIIEADMLQKVFHIDCEVVHTKDCQTHYYFTLKK